MKSKSNVYRNIIVGIGIALFVATAARNIQANEKRDFLYIGDGGSLPNGSGRSSTANTVKRFDARTGQYLESLSPQTAAVSSRVSRLSVLAD
jgi:hypothetical protein